MSFWRFIDPNERFGPELIGTLDYKLSALALLIAVMAALVMLPSIDHFRASDARRTRLTWLAAGSIVMACGIWSMHFTAMLAFSIPVDVGYDVGTTIASIVPAIVGCGIALAITGQRNLSARRILLAALALALGIGTMHYSGMEAMRADAVMRYDPKRFVFSILVAYFFAAAALFIVFSLRERLRSRALVLLLGALAMGIAVTGMHFVAASATHFYPSDGSMLGGWIIPPYGLGYALASASMLIVGAFLVASVVESRLTAAALSLQESEVRHRSVIETMLDCHIVIDEAGLIRSFNRAAEEMFGYASAEVLNQSVSILMGDSLAAEHYRYIDACNQSRGRSALGTTREIDHGARRKNGEEFPVELCTTSFETKEGRFYSGIIRDISERRISEAKNNMLVAVIESTETGVLIADDQSIIQYVNPAYVQQVNYGADRILGRHLSTIEGLEDRSLFEELANAMQLGEVWSGLIRVDGDEGRFCERELTVTPVRASSGRISHFAALVQDVTEKLSLERKLYQAQKLESIGQLAAGIAHEINTPTQYVGDNIRFLKDAFGDIRQMIEALTALRENDPKDVVQIEVIAGVLEDADVEYLKEEIPRAIDQSLEGVERVSKIVRAMKEFSHPSQEKMLIDLNQAIASTITVASNEWKYVADVETDLDPDLPLVSCNPGEFNQVILNMIVNAAHSIAEANGDTGETKGEISVSTRSVGGSAEIRIADTGIGMSGDVRARIFDPFFTTKEVGRGTGQGLSIAYNVVVEKHGGAITVESEPGEGACFVIRLPLDDAVDGAEAAA